jgi:hypothetical protein
MERDISKMANGECQIWTKVNGKGFMRRGTDLNASDNEMKVIAICMKDQEVPKLKNTVYFPMKP